MENNKIDYEKEEILQYPFMGSSRHLIENFSIIGYEDSLIEDMIRNKTKHRPSIISTITSAHVNTERWSNSIVINQIYPNMPQVYIDKPKSSSSIIFSFCFDNLSGNSKYIYCYYCYLFYEKYQDKYYVPKVFCIISQYPFFSTFKIICEEIHSLFVNPTEIPIEYILYCIINFSPSPVSDSFEYEFFPGKNPIQITKLSGYPYVDFNLPELFSYLSLAFVVEVFCLTTLESEIVFFSENLEMLNMIMYIFSILNYPCNDSNYFWHIVSVSKYDYLNESNCFVVKGGSFILGVNASYEDIAKDEKFKNRRNYFHIADLDNKRVRFRPYPNRKLSAKEEKLSKLMLYIEAILKDKKVTSHFLKKNIQELMQTLDKILHEYNPKYSIKKEFVEFYCSSKDIQAVSRNIQEAFYNFNLNIMKIFYEDNSVLSKMEQKKKKPSDYKDKDEEIKENQLVLLERNLNYKYYSDDEITFCQEYINSYKYNIYFKNFIQRFECLSLYRISLLFSEQFIFINQKIPNAPLMNQYFDIMDEYYNVKDIVPEKVSFSKINKFILNLSLQLSYDVIKNEQEQEPKEQLYLNQQKPKHKLIKLNRRLLLKFIQIMNKTINFIESLPFYSYITKDQILLSHRENIRNVIENRLIELGLISNKELIISSLISYFTMSLSFQKCEIYHLDSIKQNLDSLSYCARQNLFLLLKITYNLFLEEKARKDIKVIESDYINIFYFFINYIRTKSIVPDEPILRLVTEFYREIDHLTTLYSNQENNLKHSGNHNSNQSQVEGEIAKEDKNKLNNQLLNNTNYKLKAKYVCQEGKISLEELINIALENNESCNIPGKSIIKFAASKYNRKSLTHKTNSRIIKDPKIVIKCDNGKIEADFYSPQKLFSMTKEILKDFSLKTDIFSLHFDSIIQALINASFYARYLPFLEFPNEKIEKVLLKLIFSDKDSK